MATIVYALCGLTSIACAVLLLRAYSASRVRLLLWAGLCFVGLALNNVLLFVDMRMIPQVDLSVWRSLPALAGLLLLVYGLVWESR
jgi:hydrogenase/urease accessory protein HupE